jgi:hypothetical protein
MFDGRIVLELDSSQVQAGFYFGGMTKQRLGIPSGRRDAIKPTRRAIIASFNIDIGSGACSIYPQAA